MKLTILSFVSFLFFIGVSAQPTFQIIPLGVRGGLDESNLSSYALAVNGTMDYLLLDAGTVHTGIQKAIDAGIWKGDATAFQKEHVKGYLISHPHLDHVSGMILNATDDSPKPVYATEKCITAMTEKYFSWKNWANFTNEGEKPTLSKYTFVHLTPGAVTPVRDTKLSVTAFALSHGNPYGSTAFLVSYQENSILYLGDTGSDEIEKSDKLHLLWQHVGNLIRIGKLKAIFIEVSYAGDQPLNQLFGHLTPQLFTNEMNVLAGMAGETNLKKVPIVITHMKPSGDRETRIRKELSDLNGLGLTLIFAEQSKRLEF